MKTKRILLTLIRLALVMLWVPVAVDKLWDPSGFHSTLLRQPFPNWWADVLFWLLPLLELLAAVLIAWPRKTAWRGVRTARASRSNLRLAYLPLHLGFALSTFLMLAFTIFILLGVLDLYEKRPCGCGSVISGLSWEQHLWFNLAFLMLSAVGLRLVRRGEGDPGTPPFPKSGHQPGRSRDAPEKQFHGNTHFISMRFPRLFAVFRRRAVCVPTLPRGCLQEAPDGT